LLLNLLEDFSSRIGTLENTNGDFEKNYMPKWAEVNNTASRYPVIQLPPDDVDSVTFRVGEQESGNYADLSLFRGSFVITLNSGGNSGNLFGGFDDNGKMYLNGIGTPSDTAEESVVVNKGYVDDKCGGNLSSTIEDNILVLSQS
jgi:hypothetical protein